MAELPKTWEEWVANFSEWQDRVGFDREWLGDFDLSILFDWDRAGDVIEYGDYTGRAKWERALQVPHQNIRDALISMITVQGDTEFASVEQQRHLLDTAPTDYDRYAAARIMAEEQRHGWQMAYLLMTYFGQQGRREAQKLLERNAQDGDRLLGAFNRPMPHWLDFFCYTMFVDRDGKFQLGMLSTSAFKPLAASMGPMLKEIIPSRTVQRPTSHYQGRSYSTRHASAIHEQMGCYSTRSVWNRFLNIRTLGIRLGS